MVCLNSYAGNGIIIGGDSGGLVGKSLDFRTIGVHGTGGTDHCALKCYLRIDILSDDTLSSQTEAYTLVFSRVSIDEPSFQHHGDL